MVNSYTDIYVFQEWLQNTRLVPNMNRSHNIGVCFPFSN